MSCVNLLSQVPCEIAAIEDLLGTCSKDRSLLADLRYLQLLLSESSHLRKEICNLIEMRLKRSISPHVDLELQYHPITLALFQVSCAPFTTITKICFFTFIACFWQQGCGYGYDIAASSNKAKSHHGIPQILDQHIIICTHSSIFTLLCLNVETSRDSNSNIMLCFLLQRHCLESALHVEHNNVLRLAATSVCFNFSQLSQASVFAVCGTWSAWLTVSGRAA